MAQLVARTPGGREVASSSLVAPTTVYMNSDTAMRYKSPDEVYDFKRLDKWNVADEAERLDVMVKEKQKLGTEGYEVL